MQSITNRPKAITRQSVSFAAMILPAAKIDNSGEGDEKCLLFRNIPFLYPLKMSENLWLAKVFKEGTGIEQLAKMD